MAESNTIDSSKIFSSIQEHSTDNNANIESKKNDYNYKHYFCAGCHKFPFIKFCKDRKKIRFTCSCFNNKKIPIEELFKINSNKDNLPILFSENNSYINIENELLCKKHNKKFKCFSKLFLNNYCEDCDQFKINIYDNDIIRFDDIKIEEKKIEELIEKINDNKVISEKISEEASHNNIKLSKNNDNIDVNLSEEEEKRFKKLIFIIIDDYQSYPNFSHYFNIKNLLYFFKIEDKPIDEKGNLDDNLFEKNEPIIIEYINNISNKTKLFSKIFVKNNKTKFKIEIEGTILDLIEDYEFKTKEKNVTVKLYLKKTVSEINMFKMFSNCTNLIYVNGISKLRKIININKIFYNCIHLSSIPDLKDWKIGKNNGYLMFFNCISFIFFPYEKELNLNKIDEGFLGILISKYLKYNKEIIISNIYEDKEGFINLFKNRIKIEDKNKEIMILDGKDDEKELIACFNYDKKGVEDELKILYINGNKVGNEIKIKLRIINKIKDMDGIIERKELELTNWNISNVKNLSRLFYNCESLSSLPDISKWNTNNVTDISFLFYGCKFLSSLPDLSKWNTNKVTNMKALFKECESLTSLPDISKWNTNNVIDISFLFYGCKSLSSLPDILEYK